MLFALLDVGVEIGEPSDTDRFEAGDVAQTLDVSRRQADMYAKLQHIFSDRSPHQTRHPAQIVFRICVAQDSHPSSRFQVASMCKAGLVQARAICRHRLPRAFQSPQAWRSS